jgi:vacuolar-type H+-ATPase subunit H
MKLDKLKKGIQKAWAWLKKYWWIPFGLVIGIFILVVLRDMEKISWLWKAFDKANDSYKEEVEAIEKGRDIERKATDDAIKRYEDAIRKLESDYAKEGKELEEKKKEEIKAYVAIYDDDPEELAKIIEEKFGVKYVP